MAELSRRPDPEELLRRVQAEERRDRRGRLKVFLGYAPRVGKSFRMFDEGRRRKERSEWTGVFRLRLPLPWPGVPHCNAWAVAAGDGVATADPFLS